MSTERHPQVANSATTPSEVDDAVGFPPVGRRVNGVCGDAVVPTGRHRVQIIYFFRMQIGSQTPYGIGLRSGGPLRRMRRFLGLSRELWIEIFGKSWPIEV